MIKDGDKPHRVRATKFILDLLSPLLLYYRANWAIRARAAWILILLVYSVDHFVGILEFSGHIFGPPLSINAAGRLLHIFRCGCLISSA
jgi:hypothetical protein